MIGSSGAIRWRRGLRVVDQSDAALADAATIQEQIVLLRRIKSFADVLDLNTAIHIGNFAAFEHHAAERHLRRQVRRWKWFVTRDDKMKGVRRSRRESRLVLTAADDPARSLPDHLALLVEQEHHGAGGLHFFRKSVLQREWHNGLLSDDSRWRNCDGQLRRC